MFYIIDINGTTKTVVTEPIYQGSAGANKIILVAPFSNNAQITVSAMLPNGIPVKVPQIMEPTILPTMLQDANGNKYTAFSLTVDELLTTYAGAVQIQFRVVLGNGKYLDTYKTQFKVQEGVVTEPLELPTDEDYMDAILNYLAQMNSDPVKSIYYSAPQSQLLPTSIETVPSGFTEYTSDGFTASNSYNNARTNKVLFGVDFAKISRTTVGFELALNSIEDVGIIQLFMQSTTEAILIGIALSEDGISYNNQSIAIQPTRVSVPISIRYNFGSEKAKYIIVNISSGKEIPVIINAVEIFSPTLDGEYIIAQRSGAESVIPANNGALITQYLGEAQEYSQQAEQSAGEAQASAADSQQAYTNITNLAGKVDGYPILEDVNGEPKIPSVYFNQVDIKEYIEITNENELATIEAQVGDVAFLVEEVGGVQTTTKSWILLSVADGVRNWVVYGTSYATNAGNANYAATAGNAAKVGGIAFEGIYTSEQYDSIVANNAIIENVIYIVEV
jgi:hypothetical protein